MNKQINEYSGTQLIWTLSRGDFYKFLGNCPPTPPLNQHFALSEKYVLMLA